MEHTAGLVGKPGICECCGHCQRSVLNASTGERDAPLHRLVVDGNGTAHAGDVGGVTKCGTCCAAGLLEDASLELTLFEMSVRAL